MKVERLGDARVIMKNEGSRHNYFGWPTVTRLQNGKIAAVASGYRLGHVCPFGKAVISYSEDEGESFTVPAPVIDTVLDDRDAGILAFGDKSVMVTSFNNTRTFQRNYNNTYVRSPYVEGYLNGITDEEEVAVLGSTFRISNDCGVTFGEVKRCPVSSPHGPCVLSDGTVLWVGWLCTGDYREPEDEPFLQAYRVNPDGTCEYVGSIESVPTLRSEEPYAVEAADGTVICHIRVQGGGGLTDGRKFTLYQTESHDQGKTWTKPHQILSDFGGAPAHILRLADGTLISSYGYREAPYAIRVMFSKDNGKTWDTDHEIYVNGVHADLGYPSTVQLKNGDFLTVFYAHEKPDAPAVILAQKWRIAE